MRSIGIVCGAGIISGKEIMALELGEGMKTKGYAVDFVTSSWGSADFRKRLRGLGVAPYVVRVGYISATLTLDCLRMTAHQALHWPGLLYGYRRFLRRVVPVKVIHTNWHHLLLLWPFLKPERDLFWLHELVPNKPQYRRVFGALARHLQCFVPVSHAAARSLAAIGIAPNKIRVIYNGLKDPVPGGGRRTVTPHRLRIGIIGQVGSWKGHEDLLEAFALVVRSHPAAELHVFGRGSDDYERRLKHRADSLGVGGRITWHGFVSDRATIFQSIEICSVPSRCEESFGLVAAEAGFFGLPVVASRRGGLPEIVEDGVTGFLVEAGQPAELAARIQMLFDDGPLRQVMGEEARARVTARFCRERLVDDFTHLLEEK